MGYSVRLATQELDASLGTAKIILVSGGRIRESLVCFRDIGGCAEFVELSNRLLEGSRLRAHYADEKMKDEVNVSSRMIGLAAKIRVHQVRPFGMRGIAVRRLQGHKDRINFRENLRIVAFKDPSSL